jgi:hypothetical protein
MRMFAGLVGIGSRVSWLEIRVSPRRLVGWGEQVILVSHCFFNLINWSVSNVALYSVNVRIIVSNELCGLDQFLRYYSKFVRKSDGIYETPPIRIQDSRRKIEPGT